MIVVVSMDDVVVAGMGDCVTVVSLWKELQTNGVKWGECASIENQSKIRIKVWERILHGFHLN